MNSTYADLASAYFVDDVPGATIPGSRLSAVLVKVDARAPLTVFQQEFLRARGYDALLELAIGQVDHEAFREKSRREKEKRLREKIAAQQREAAEQRRRDEATDRANKAFFAKREEEIERRRLHNRFGQGYIERGHYRRVMRILRSVANGNPIGADDIEEGDPDELARQYRDLKTAFPRMNVFGGCCGTDFVHVEKIGNAILAA